jgi:hypothetical protein
MGPNPQADKKYTLYGRIITFSCHYFRFKINKAVLSNDRHDLSLLFGHCIVLYNGQKILKGQSESLNRRTDITRANRY